MFLLPDGTLWVQLANFAVFFAVLSVVFLRPVGRAIRKRREYLNSLSSDYDKYQTEAGALRAQAEAERSAARNDAAAAIAKARGQASNESAALGTQYAAQVQATVDAAHRTVANELDAARKNETGIIRELADMMLDRAISGDSR
jgi:F0F1-type ATP synthase membrane subunit b/b'